MDFFTTAWLFWILAFLVIEGAALIRKAPGDTLSEHVWKWFSIKNKGEGWRARRIFLIGFLAWLVIHFLTGGWA